MRVLLVEDDPDLAEVVALGLRNESYAVDVADTSDAAEQCLQTTAYDVVCLDLGLPDGDGLALLRRLGRDPGLHRPRRLLVLTARDGVADRVAGLDAGRAEKAGLSVEEVRAQTEKSIPLGRYGTAEEFGKVAAFLVSGANTYTTGQHFLVDGAMVKAI